MPRTSKRTSVQEEREDPPSKRRKADDSSSSASASTSAKSGSSVKSSGKNNNNNTEGNVKTVVVKGKAPVDPECAAGKTMHVFIQGNDIYDVMLNQTNVGNNNNKYYIIQLLEDDKAKRYAVWNRWGRVGFKGQNSMTPCGPDLDKAKQLFCQKFVDKTKNDWSERKKFKKVAGKYDLVKIDYSEKNSDGDVPSKKENPVEIPESKLEDRLQALIKLICDVKEMENAVTEMKYDAQKAPLGRLTKAQIKAGYAALKVIDSCIDKGDYGPRLMEACNDFYTRIPHYFGMSRPPVIRTKEEVKKKAELLEALGDIEIALRVLKECKATENPVDAHYKSLNCQLRPLDSTEPVFKTIEEYLKNTHAPTHMQYSMSIMDVFEVNREVENANFVDYGNRMLLWHGSRLTNMVGILSQGLRIAPPEAPVTGYMFGKGVYFADMSSKSANYCFPSRSKNVGLVLLSEVSLGKCRDLIDADYEADQLPAGYQSVRGLGGTAPDPSQNVVWPCGTVVPLGKPVSTEVVNSDGYTLNYNEYVVYNTQQIKMKYLVKVKFNFK